MSLLNWLATQARGVGAQINQWDNGATYNSVVEEEKRKRQQPQRPIQQWQPPQQPRTTFAPQQPTYQGTNIPVRPTVRTPENSRVQPPPQRPSFLDYLNPLGEHGIFGAQQQATLQKATKPVTNWLEEAQAKVDATDDKEGHQWTDLNDYVRFAKKLPAGMAQGIVEAPQKVGVAVSGVRVNDGKREDLGAAQRAGSFVDGFVSVAGLPVGGSGTLLKAAAPGAKKFFSNSVGQAAAKLAKDSGTEALEEVIQTGASDLADNGQFNATLGDYAQSAAFGALGGGMMSGAGQTVNAARAIPAELNQRTHNQLVETNPDYARLDAVAKSSANLHERAEANRAMKHIRNRATNSQGGFIAGPLAGDFSKAKEQGLVFEGVDGKPRFEVDDSGAKIKNPDGKTLGEMLDHPELFKNYPELKSLKTEIYNKPLTSSGSGYYDYDNKTLAINKADPDPLDVAIHEVQHAIQDKEGFSIGSSPSYSNAYKADLFNRRYDGMTTEQRYKIDTAINEQVDKAAKEARASGNPLTGEQKVALRQKLHEEAYGAPDPVTKLSDFEVYRRSAGEAEARAVQARMNMPMSERYVDGKNTLDDSLDVPKQDLIIRNDSDKALSVEQIRNHPEMLELDSKFESIGQEIAQLEQAGRSKNYSQIVQKKKSQDMIIKQQQEVANRLSKQGMMMSVEADGTDAYSDNYIREQVASYSDPKKYVDDIVEGIWQRNKQGKGVDSWLTPDEYGGGYSGRNAVSNNSPFYQAFYKSEGRKPTKRAIADLFQEELDGKETILSAMQEISPHEATIYQQIKENAESMESLINQASQPKPEVDARVKRALDPNDKLQYKNLNATERAAYKEAKGASRQDATPTNQSANATPDQPNKAPKTTKAQQPKQKTQKTQKADKQSSVQVQSKVSTATNPLDQPASDVRAKSAPQSSSSTDNTTKFTKEQRDAWDKENIIPTIKNTAVSYGKKADSSDLVKAIEKSERVTKAAKLAMDNGRELHFYAKTDKNGRSVGIERMNPNKQRIEAGFVVDDETGGIIGNHIKVDNTGVQVNVGGELVNIESVTGNPLEWKGNYRVSETMSRNIDRNAPTKEVADRTKAFLITSKYKAEANFRTELETEYKKLGNRIKQTMDARPKGVKTETYFDDIFGVLNGDTKLSDLQTKYPAETYSAIEAYHNETRTLYDSLLERINKERVRFGQAPIEGRKNYITHLQELSNSKSFAGDAYQSIKNSFIDDMNMKTRGNVPGEIAGRTEGFKPISAYNKFLQRRTGDTSLRDPFKAVQEYLDPALYNIHMTETTARARAIESAFRTAEHIKRLQPDQFTKNMEDMVKHYRKQGDTSKLLTGFQEYANALGRKTQRWDRQIIDSSDTMGKSIRAWQFAQRKGGQATIVGNISSVMMQPLNQVVTLADGGVRNYTRGIVANLSRDKSIDKSAFIRARATKADQPIRGVGGKVLDAGGVPLQAVEMAAVRQTWHVMHSKAKQDGYKGQKAIDKADLDTERLVAGRGIADRPELYRSTVANGFLQFTLEVNAQNKAFWQDLNVKQKATFMVAAASVNALYEEINGQTPLPDFLTPVVEAFLGDSEDEEEKKLADKLTLLGQRLVGEAVSMNPITSSAASAAMTKDQRKALFGSDADVSRFEGTAAPIQLVRNAVDAAGAAKDGDWKTARDKGLKTVPFGNQIQKTIRGAEANRDGYVAGPSGRVMYETGKTAVDKTKNLLFGPYATKNAKNYFDSGRWPFSDKQTENIKKLSGDARTKYMDTIIAMNKAGVMTTDKNVEKALSGADLEKLKSQKGNSAKQYEVNDKISSESKQFFDMYNNMTTEERSEFFKTNNSADYEYKKAMYENNIANKSLSAAGLIRAKKELRRAEIGKDYSKDLRDLYSLNKSDLVAYLSQEEKGVDKEKLFNQLVEFDQKLFKAGLISYLKFKNGLAMGRQSSGRRTGGRSGGRSGGSRGRANDGIDIATIKAAMKIRGPKTDEAPKSLAQAPKMKQTSLQQYRMVGGKRVPIRVSGKKRVA